MDPDVDLRQNISYIRSPRQAYTVGQKVEIVAGRLQSDTQPQLTTSAR
ncbi:hypothetical protein [Stutzerimonas tarimensis]|uniref:Uncharacterized protein n=1 Tax=Stutzerimonas tarimensis TaxID=1507735 RepID=A0ABV7T9F1_9GAMM